MTDEDRDPIDPQAWPADPPPDPPPEGYVALSHVLFHKAGPGRLDQRRCQDNFRHLCERAEVKGLAAIVRSDDGTLSPLPEAYWSREDPWDLYLTGKADLPGGRRGSVFLPALPAPKRARPEVRPAEDPMIIDELIEFLDALRRAGRIRNRLSEAALGQLAPVSPDEGIPLITESAVLKLDLNAVEQEVLAALGESAPPKEAEQPKQRPRGRPRQAELAEHQRLSVDLDYAAMRRRGRLAPIKEIVTATGKTRQAVAGWRKDPRYWRALGERLADDMEAADMKSAAVENEEREKISRHRDREFEWEVKRWTDWPVRSPLDGKLYHSPQAYIDHMEELGARASLRKLGS